MFPNARNTGPLDAGNWYARVFKPWLEAAEITDFRFHDLRHTTATRLRAQGVPIEDIAKVFRHADTRMTERYATWRPAGSTTSCRRSAELTRSGTGRRRARKASGKRQQLRAESESG